MKKYLSKLTLSNANYTLLLVCFLSFIPNITIYCDAYKIVSQLDNYHIGFLISLPLFFIFAYNIIFSLLTWPWLTKPIAAVLIIMSAVLFYAEYNFGIYFDYSMIRNIFETDSSEAASYFSLSGGLWFLTIGILPTMIFMMIRLKKESLIGLTLRKIIYMAVSALGIWIIAQLYYQDYASVVRNHHMLSARMVPASFIHNTYRYVDRNYIRQPIAYKKIGTDAKQTLAALKRAKTKPTLLFMVVGETARAQNFLVNGYHRNTTPYTHNLPNMLSFKDTASCGTSTAVSVPCMFSRMDHAHLNLRKAHRQDNVLDILYRAHVDVLWKENDGGDKRVAQNLPKIVLDRQKVTQNCNGETCYDIALLNNIDQQITSMKGNRVIVLHFIGSHGPTYYKRYPKAMERFTPNCDRADIENCSVEQITNTYDNTLVYSDYVLRQVINKLNKYSDQFNTGMIYISDHGESLGEDGLFLHGAPYSLAPIYQIRVPFMVWLSKGLQQSQAINMACMRKETQKKGWSQDNLFDSLLGIMNVQTSLYRPEKDIFSACRQ